MLIHFIHPGKAYLPELAAYQSFLQSRGHGALFHTSAEEVPTQATVLWWMCGAVPGNATGRHASAWHVHEYASASVPPAAWVKDKIKSWRQPRPHYRIFQNAWVKDRMGFSDAVPYEYRDMGVSPEFLDASALPRAPSFDFVYLGDMQRLAGFRPLLQGLEEAGRSLLLIGDVPEGLREWLHDRSFATMAGRVSHAQVPALLIQARYGLNLVPGRAPYHQQTSTKLLEYCAVGLPIISTDYPWVREFEKSAGARFIYLPGDATVGQYARLLGPELDGRSHTAPAVRQRTWQDLLEGMQIWKYLGSQR
ncbi:glycosyltransferase [Acidovorax sp. SUPP2825]|uniref:glycosyltransferase family protein n=1 Tax=Acidovorax sp. SUPP2825 TaxID=2920879 RepID=UPI0023DE4CBE|nr:glycosyltransferase [Acidovorax sp. SUPP2825]GKS94316.1 glycosyltransferase [Acidovorax sp. SUPP2825]